MGLSLHDRLKHLLPGWLTTRTRSPRKPARWSPSSPSSATSCRRAHRHRCRRQSRILQLCALRIAGGSRRSSRIRRWRSSPAASSAAASGCTSRAVQPRGSSILHVPQVKREVDLHYGASLRRTDLASHYVELPVRVSTLDAFAFDDVGFIKVDVEAPTWSNRRRTPDDSPRRPTW